MRGSEKEGIKLIHEAADNGCTSAQFNMGIILDIGKFNVKSDPVLAVNYIQLAADSGHPKALNNLAYKLERGNGRSKNIQLAKEMYDKAAQLGNGIAQFNFSIHNPCSEPLYSWMDQIKHESPPSLNNLAVYIFQGKYLPENEKQGSQWLKQSADRGVKEALFNYANCLISGRGVEQNHQLAARIFKMSSDKGFIPATNNIAAMAINGMGITTNYPEGIKLLKKGVDKNDLDALLNYGIVLAYGIGVQANYNEALQYFKKAHELGNSHANLFL